MSTFAPPPSHTGGGLYLMLFSRDYKNVASSREVGRKEEGRAQATRAVYCWSLFSLYSKCFSGAALVNLVETRLSFIEMLKIYPKCRQVLKTSIQYESCLIDLTLNPAHFYF